MPTAASATARWGQKWCVLSALHSLLHKPALHARNKVHVYGENGYTHYISNHTD